MELPLAQRAESTLQYQLVPPEASQDRFIVFAARVLALAAIASALNPLALATSRLISVRMGPYAPNSWSYSPWSSNSSSSGLEVAFNAVSWLNGICAGLVVIAAIGTFVRRNLMRIALAGSLGLLALGLLTSAILSNWQRTSVFAPTAASKDAIEILISLVPALAPLTFPFAAGALLWHPAFRRISHTESDLLPGGAQGLCFIGIVIAGIGLLFRPLALLSMLGGVSTERAPLGLPILTDSFTVVALWHVLTRIALLGCSAALLVGSVMLMRGKIRGRTLLLRQAIIGIVINSVEAVLILVMIFQVSDMLIAISGAVQHLAFILPGLALDIAIWIYFSRPQTEKALAARLKPA